MLGLSVTILMGLTGRATESPNSTEEIIIPLTLEYVCEEFDIPTEEFEGVDFDAFVASYGLTYENIHDEAVRFMLDNYKANNGEIEYFDFSYLTD